jgi:hypothetical protein
MDSAAILMVLFGSVISVTTALTFMEVRRMRKSGTKSSASSTGGRS